MTIENLEKPNLSGFNPQSVDDVQQSEANVQKIETSEMMLEKAERLSHILSGFNPQSVDDVQQCEANVQKSEDHAYETEDYETQSGDELQGYESYETEDYETQSGDELQGYESFDSDEVLEHKLNQILRADCTREFVSFFKQYPYFLHRRSMELIFMKKAKKCVLLLLKGGLGWRPSMTKCSDEEKTCLSLAASYFCDPDVVEAILSEDRKNYMVNLPYYRTLPVQAALENLRNSKLLAEQINADSFTKLIIFLLYLPELRPIMKVVQMLASRTRGINDMAFNYAEDGEVEKVAALLLVAREKVMAPFIETGMSIGDLINHILDWGSEANYLRGKPKYVLNLMKAHQLLEVFKKAGRPLEAFGALEGEKVPEASIILVAKTCMEVGHKLEYKDIDFGDACRLDERGMEIICHELGIPSREGEKKPASKSMSPCHSKNLQGLNPFQMIPNEKEMTMEKMGKHHLSGFNPQSVDVQPSEANVQKNKDHVENDLQVYETDEDLKNILDEILRADDTTKFVEFFKEYPDFLDFNCVRVIIIQRAKKCLLLLLNGGLGWFPDLINYSNLGETCLSWATSHFCDPDVVEAVLAKKDYEYMALLPLNNKLPVQQALEQLRKFDLLAEQINAESFTKLIIFLLYLPELRSIMKTVRVLALHTNVINNIAFDYAEKGEVEKLAALLLVAREKVMTPFTETGMMITELITQMYHYGAERDYFRGGRQYMSNLIKAHQLLYVIQVVGEPLEALLASEEDKLLCAAVTLVGKACMEVGHKLEYKDLDFGDACGLHEREMKIICATLDIPCKESEKKSASEFTPRRHRKERGWGEKHHRNNGWRPLLHMRQMVLRGAYRQFHGVASVGSTFREGASQHISRPTVGAVVEGKKMEKAAHNANAAPFFRGFGFLITNLKRGARYL